MWPIWVSAYNLFGLSEWTRTTLQFTIYVTCLSKHCLYVCSLSICLLKIYVVCLSEHCLCVCVSVCLLTIYVVCLSDHYSQTVWPVWVNIVYMSAQNLCGLFEWTSFVCLCVCSQSMWSVLVNTVYVSAHNLCGLSELTLSMWLSHSMLPVWVNTVNVAAYNPCSVSEWTLSTWLNTFYAACLSEHYPRDCTQYM